MLRSHIYLFSLLSLGLSTQYKIGILGEIGHIKSVLQEITKHAADKFNNAAIGSDPTISVITKGYKEGSIVNLVDSVCSLMNDNVVAVISYDDSSDTKTLANILSSLHIPIISASATDPFIKTGKRDYLMLMTPSDVYQSKVIYDTLKQKDWKQVAILASVDDHGVNGVIHLQDLLIGDSEFILTNVLYFKFSLGKADSVDIDNQLDIIEYSLTKVIILNCKATLGKDILIKAQERGLLDEGFVWILTDGITMEFKELEVNGVYPSYYNGLIGITPAFQKTNKYNTWRDSFLMSNGMVTKDGDLNSYVLNVYDSIGIIGEALKAMTSLLEPSVSCSSASSWSSGKGFMEKLTKVSYEGVTGKYSFDKNGETNKIAYNVVNFKENAFFKVGSWDNESGLTFNEERIVFLGGGTSKPPGIPNTLNGRHLRLGATTEPPFMWRDNFETSGQGQACQGNDCWYGYLADYIKHLSKDLNFTYSYVEPADKSFGGYNKTTGLWSGLIGDLIAGKTDLIMMDLSISSERQAAIDFLFPFMDSGIRAVVLATSGTNNPFFFLMPFHISVWLALIVAIIITSLVLNFFNKYSPFGIYGKKMHAMQVCECENCTELRYKKKFKQKTFLEMKEFKCLVEKTEDSDPLEDLSVNNSLWIVGAGFVGQGGDALPISLSGRFVLFSWWFFVMLITSMYTANLTAFITLSNLGVSLNEVKDVIKQDKYDWGVITQRYPEELLMNHIDTDYHEVVRRGKKLTSLEEALQKVEEGNFVFIDEAPVLKYNLKESCDIYAVGSEFQSFEYAFGIAQNSPYETLLNAHILKSRELGRFEELWEKWAGENPLCNNKKIGSESTLNIMNIIGIFYFLCIGVLISLSIAVIETLLAAYRDPSTGKHKSFFRKLHLRLKLKLNDVLYEWLGMKKKKVVPHTMNVDKNDNNKTFHEKSESGRDKLNSVGLDISNSCQDHKL